MAHSSEDMDSIMKRAWSVLLPSCVAKLDRQDSFGLGPQSDCTPDQFYDILYLWWNQQLKLANLNQLEPNHLDVIKKYLNNTNSNNKMDVDSVEDNNHNSCQESKEPNLDDEDLKQISNYLGFYQPKNGTVELLIVTYIM